MISYAQNFEDVLLYRCFQGRTEGFYIDVGAMDPVEHSVTKFFYDQGWSGINIEPNEWFYNKLVEQRPRDTNLNVALGDREERRRMHVFEKFGISTFDSSHSARFTEQGFEVEERIVKVTTLAAVCREYVARDIDFLKIDCEGWESFVIRGGDWDNFRPIVVVIEATEPLSTAGTWSEWEDELTSGRRYEMVYFDGLNRFYLRQAYSHLREHFKVPPNFFDHFTLAETIQSRQQIERAEKRITELESEQARLSANLAQLTESRDAAENNARTHAARIAELNEQLSHASSDNDRLRAEVAERDAQIGALEASRQQLLSQQQDLLQNITQAKLWIGRLSEDLARTRLRI